MRCGNSTLILTFFLLSSSFVIRKELNVITVVFFRTMLIDSLYSLSVKAEQKIVMLYCTSLVSSYLSFCSRKIETVKFERKI